MKNNSNKKVGVITLQIDRDLWNLFKEKTLRTISLNDAIVELIKEKVKHQKRDRKTNETKQN